MQVGGLEGLRPSKKQIFRAVAGDYVASNGTKETIRERLRRSRTLTM